MINLDVWNPIESRFANSYWKSNAANLGWNSDFIPSIRRESAFLEMGNVT